MMDCSTCEELLSRFEKGELDTEETKAVEGHLASCADCRHVLDEYRSLSNLSATDSGPLLEADRAQRALSAILDELAIHTTVDALPEVMTIEEVAAFLRVEPDDLDVELDTLPAFEIGGRLRVRRSRLLEWIEERERKARSRRILSLVHNQ